MSQELVLHLSIVVIFILYILVWGIAFIISGIKWDNIYSPSEGLLDAILLRIFLSIGILGIVIYILEPSLMEWSEFNCPSPIRFVGIPLGIVTLILLFLEMKYLGYFFSPTLKTIRDHQLITKGIYRWVRHPMYMTLILIWFAFILLSANWFIGIFGFMAYALIIFRRLPKEEKMLIDYFGEDYLDYIKHTGKLFPRFSSFVKKKK